VALRHAAQAALGVTIFFLWRGYFAFRCAFYGAWDYLISCAGIMRIVFSPSGA